jgi:hypothetical protein
MVLRFTVAEVQANHIHTGTDHGFEQSRIAGSRA